MSKTKTTNTKTKKPSVKRISNRQYVGIKLAASMIDTSPLPEFADTQKGWKARTEAADKRAEQAVFLAHRLVEFVRENV